MLEIRGQLAHPDLTLHNYLCFYGDPDATEPFYIGALIGKSSIDYPHPTEIICAASGRPGKIAGGAPPALIGTYWMPGLNQCPNPADSIKSTGECAAILAEIYFRITEK
jgi:hypothetical protein